MADLSKQSSWTKAQTLNGGISFLPASEHQQHIRSSLGEHVHLVRYDRPPNLVEANTTDPIAQTLFEASQYETISSLLRLRAGLDCTAYNFCFKFEKLLPGFCPNNLDSLVRVSLVIDLAIFEKPFDEIFYNSGNGPKIGESSVGVLESPSLIDSIVAGSNVNTSISQSRRSRIVPGKSENSQLGELGVTGLPY
ncbi:hypothetical protein Tco_1539934 [Tanacetum coccineum]